jgi:hypothetical protein
MWSTVRRGVLLDVEHSEEIGVKDVWHSDERRS